MARFLSATYHTEIKVAEFICDDGRHLLRCGGTLPWRLNNAGDLMSPLNSEGQPAPKKTKNYIGFAKVPNRKNGTISHFFIFPDYQSGREQLALSVRRLYAEKTLPQLVQKYAPSDSNDTDKYITDLLKETKLDPTALVKDFSSADFERVLDAIEKIEGYHNEQDSRREVWVPVSRITTTDGSRPLADEEVVLRVNGRDTAVKSNRYGQLPPIPHPEGQHVEVLRKQSDGRLQSVGTLSGDKGEHYTLKRWFERFLAMLGVQGEPHSASVRRAAMAYVVEPGDTLSNLAARFETTVEQIKRDNGLRRDAIFVGQRLGIYGPLPAGGGTAVMPRRAAPRRDPNNPRALPQGSQQAVAVRTSSGKPIATVRADQRLAPWMAVAFREATAYAGKDEAEITKTHNYHRLVTDSDRAGGRVVVVKDKNGKPVLGKDGKLLTKKRFDGLASLAGDDNPWCASFVNYCLKEGGYPPGRSHMSSFTFGADNDLFVRLDKPVYGAIRFSRRQGGGHVCLVYGEINDMLIVIGGNQGDRISFELMSTGATGEAFYVPVTYAEHAKADGAVMPDVDIGALRREFGVAVEISDAQIKSKEVSKKSQT